MLEVYNVFLILNLHIWNINDIWTCVVNMANIGIVGCYKPFKKFIVLHRAYASWTSLSIFSPMIAVKRYKNAPQSDLN